MVKALKKLWMIRYIQESYIELKKVVWPSQEIIRKHTILVIGISLFIAAYFAILDKLLNDALEIIL